MFSADVFTKHSPIRHVPWDMVILIPGEVCTRKGKKYSKSSWVGNCLEMFHLLSPEFRRPWLSSSSLSTIHAILEECLLNLCIDHFSQLLPLWWSTLTEKRWHHQLISPMLKMRHHKFQACHLTLSKHGVRSFLSQGLSLPVNAWCHTHCTCVPSDSRNVHCVPLMCSYLPFLC